MASFVVMQPPAGSQPDALPELIRDGFLVWGLVFAPFWLARHKLWIEAVLVGAAMLVIPAVAAKLGIGLITSYLTTLVSAFVALEGPQLRIAALRRKGWLEDGVLEADDLYDAETRYAGHLPGGPWAARA